ncbi:carboxypeptidase-like regulatory domain-containing protein [Flavobacterium gilvum]|uniref:TonB-dependent receptor n=1 Tax=Flavobacterium gilvum TaxID=1492737 RepID=A0AAC9I1T9_9FLAO|nr:carboxypeptidase-like regulatory domain-containing protein [Flavobacterium gilvum]AOW08554.1 TonB-dependent receptor [Flavobacterium gilvum]KFC58814.1 TonB-dependent receptor [Flavobacterium gilvum]
MGKFWLGTFFLLTISFGFAQKPTGFKGKIIDAKTQKPLENVVVTIANTQSMQFTTNDGVFSFYAVPPGKQLLLLKSQGFKDVILPVVVAQDKMLDLSTIPMEDNQISEQQTGVITLLESDLSDDNSGSESTSGLLQSSRDAFQQASAFNWGQARFRIRGLDSQYATTMINGVTMNKLYDGRPQWGDWGGLNNVVRNQEFTVGSFPSDYAFGGILGTQEINTRASIYRPGSTLSFSGTNTNYDWRMVGTYASGMNNNGWAFVISAGTRWATEAYFEGTNYKALAGFISIEKKINDQNFLNFSGFYTPNSRAKNSPNTAEVTELTNERYNSYWGWQDGKKRNARIKTIEEPILMLNHFWTNGDDSTLNSSLTYQFGKITNSNIDYQNANSPDPTYYKKMPSYYSSMYAKDNGEFSGEFTPDYENAEKNKESFLANNQIDWNSLYYANQSPVLDSNGRITVYAPDKSSYVLYEDHTDDKTITATSTFNTQINDNLFLTAGGFYRQLKSHNYQQLKDLLGGLYFEDIDVFYDGNQAQSDLNHPDRRVVEGDIYGYNFNYVANELNFFTNFKFTYDKVDFYLGQNFVSTNYQREGLYQNGIYPTNSFGKSEKVRFENFGFKGGILFKISGRQQVNFNGAYLSKAPTIRNTFPNARLNNSVVSGLQSENISSLDASYFYRTPKWQTRLTLFYAKIENVTQTSFFYAEGIFDDGAGYANTDAFVSQTLTHLDKKNLGTEFSFQYQLSPTWMTNFSAFYGEFTFDSNPNVIITNDAQATPENPNPVFDFGTSSLKNYHQAGMPQQALALGIEYRDPKYWWIGANINYLAKTFIDVSPISRTATFYKNPASGFNFPEVTEERAKELLKQEEFEPIILLNISGGKSWKIRGKNVGLFATVNNVLDLMYKTGGYEQARNANFRQLNQDVSSGTPNFGNKYFYGYGRTYFVNLYLNL